MEQNWLRLVKRARRNDNNFKGLLLELDPVLFIIAARLTDNISVVDDLVQVARLKIWKSLGSVDLDRPETIKSFLTNIGVNKMRDEIRLIRKKGPVRCGDAMWFNFPYISKSLSLFGGLLLEYEGYIRRIGKFEGAHKFLAEKYNISTWTMRTKFHAAVTEYLKELNE